MNRAAALRELGEVEPARDELRKLLSGLREGDTITTLAKGRARYHLALCEWRLNDREPAQRHAEESLNLYGDDEAAAPLKKQTEQLLADLKENKPLPPLAKVDTGAALEQARARFRARADLATLPLKQSALPLLDQMLGPAKSTKEVFETLDRQYREQGKPAIWFLPLSQPIAPHLDELLGPLTVQ
jgi:tetratricopeptide (TPR) repeat protein